MALSALVFTLVVVILGYRFYAVRVDPGLLQADPNRATPAQMYKDGVDFMPASSSVLFGYQFKSIAALGPIVGPIPAAQFGWLPAILWLVLGVFFIGWVQDYASSMLAMRNEGMTMGGLSYKLISPRARTLLLSFLYIYLLLIMGAFGAIVAPLLAGKTVAVGFIILTLAGVLAGQMTYRWRQDLLLTTLVTVAIALFGVWFGTTTVAQNIVGWIVGIAIATFTGSVNTSFELPAFVTAFQPHLGPIWPILFVTIACGAISGWHSLVSTSGTARQLEKETDALPVGGGAMFMEMGFAVMAFLTATVAFGGVKGYQDAGGAGAAPGGFSQGLAAFLNVIRVPREFGMAYGSVFLTIMAL